VRHSWLNTAPPLTTGTALSITGGGRQAGAWAPCKHLRWGSLLLLPGHTMQGVHRQEGHYGPQLPLLPSKWDVSLPRGLMPWDGQDKLREKKKKTGRDHHGWPMTSLPMGRGKTCRQLQGSACLYTQSLDISVQKDRTSPRACRLHLLPAIATTAGAAGVRGRPTTRTTRAHSTNGGAAAPT